MTYKLATNIKATKRTQKALEDATGIVLKEEYKSNGSAYWTWQAKTFKTRMEAITFLLDMANSFEWFNGLDQAKNSKGVPLFNKIK